MVAILVAILDDVTCPSATPLPITFTSVCTAHQRLSIKIKIISQYCKATESPGGPSTPSAPPPSPVLAMGVGPQYDLLTIHYAKVMSWFSNDDLLDPPAAHTILDILISPKHGKTTILPKWIEIQSNEALKWFRNLKKKKYSSHFYVVDVFH